MAPPNKGDLNEDEEKLLECINQGNSDDVKELLAKQTTHVDCLDKNGMTPLQQAAFKANVDICHLLLAHGADVNSSEHNQGYTALMFAALSGNTEVTQLMLEAGAKVGRENCVGRTASQMAAFVGQYQCVSLINNFFAKDDLAYYTKIQGLEMEPKLPPELLGPMYGLVIQNNLNPVGLSLYVQSHMELLDNVHKVAKVLDLLCERMMKQKATNQVLAIKFHYLASLVRQCHKSQQQHQDNLHTWLRSMLKGKTEDGFPENQEKFIRSTLRDFPYFECELLQQMVRTLSKVSIGDDPPALHLMSSTLNGQKFASEDHIECSTCGRMNKNPKKCASCKMVTYCDKDCQQLHWFTHKKLCKKLAAGDTCSCKYFEHIDKFLDLRYKELEEERRQAEERTRKEEEKRKRLQEEEEEKKAEEGKTGKSPPEAEDGGDTDLSQAVTDIDKGHTDDLSTSVDTAHEMDPNKCDSGTVSPTTTANQGEGDQHTDQAAATVQEE
ncbi:Ankyrin repeat and MYND domain-containing protein 2 [Lamellibrachia satsuma]|nr:Ankyrin repeat and MYND domain-containing protein 2 [Lamellibrachia satsuma]